MSFGADGQGRVHVLDGVNGRVVRRGADGAPDGSFPIGVTNPEDIAVAGDGTTAVLDRHRDKSVALYDPSGKPRGTLPLEGTGIPDVGSVTSILVDGSDVYAERAHGPLVKLGNLAGTPAEPRSEIPGRPSRDGLSFLNAGITDAAAGRVWVSSIERASQTHRFTRELRLGTFVRALVLLDTDKAGTIYFAAEIESSIQLYCLDRDSGAPIGSAALPVNDLPEESFRDLVVLDAGGVIHALRTEQGVTYSVYHCQ
jgi:sugar lactone lactonase YvrE